MFESRIVTVSDAYELKLARSDYDALYAKKDAIDPVVGSITEVGVSKVNPDAYADVIARLEGRRQFFYDHDFMFYEKMVDVKANKFEQQSRNMTFTPPQPYVNVIYILCHMLTPTSELMTASEVSFEILGWRSGSDDVFFKHFLLENKIYCPSHLLNSMSTFERCLKKS